MLHCRRAALRAALHAGLPDAPPADDAPPDAAQPAAGGPLVYEEGEYPAREGRVHEEMRWAERRLLQARVAA